MDNVTETEKAYLAGFFDGEGCINISSINHPNCSQPYYYLQVILTQTDYDALKIWRDKVELGKIYEHKVNKYRNKLTGPFKITWQWRMGSLQAEQFLRIILPYLVVKKGQAEIALKFRATKDTQICRSGTPESVIKLRETYKQTLRRLKKGCANTPSLEDLTQEEDLQLQLL